MPYSAISELPDYVREKPKKTQRQWMAIWNSVYEDTQDEQMAFAAANAILSDKRLVIKGWLCSELIKIRAGLPMGRINILGLSEPVNSMLKRMDEIVSAKDDVYSPEMSVDGARILEGLYSIGAAVSGFDENGMSSIFFAKEVAKRFVGKPNAYDIRVFKGSAVGDYDSERKRVLVGAVLVPDEKDLQDDIISKEEVTKAAHQFMLNHGIVGINHEEFPSGSAAVVESWITPVSLNYDSETIPEGSWMVAIKVFDDALLDRVESGELTGFSIGGYYARQSVD